MNIGSNPISLPSVIESRIAAAGQSGNQVSGSTAIATNAKSAGDDFESVFLSLMLKQMRTSMTEDGLFKGDSSDTFGGIFDLYLGKHMAQSQPLGIGKVVEAYVQNASSE